MSKAKSLLTMPVLVTRWVSFVICPGSKITMVGGASVNSFCQQDGLFARVSILKLTLCKNITYIDKMKTHFLDGS